MIEEVNESEETKIDTSTSLQSTHTKFEPGSIDAADEFDR